jgi:hypothetical protein
LDAGKLFPALAAKQKKVVAPSIILQTGKKLKHTDLPPQEDFRRAPFNLVECPKMGGILRKKNKSIMK